jgi:hypothetical protein
MAEKRTKEDNRSRGGLNEGNPNTDRTPIQPRTETNLVGGLTQHTHEDEKEGRAPENKNRNKEESSRH